MAAVVGCGPSIVPEEPMGDSTGDPPPATTTATPPPPETTGTSADPPPATTSTDPDGGTDPGTDDGTFIMPTDVPPAYQCDFFEQDCPAGEKCVPFGTGAGTAWDVLRCRPVVPDPAGPDEPCTLTGDLRGPIDDCDGGSRCIEGICRAFCIGSERAPVCEDPQSNCLIFNDPWGFCFSPCDPIAQDDCPEGDACYPVGDDLGCILDSSDGRGFPGTSCNFSDECNPGSWCADGTDVPGCMSTECCSSFCALGDPMPPCLPGQSCVPWDPGDPASTLGTCAVP